MSIFSRLTDIVNSNINALLDKAEDPEKMVRLILQEMEETLVEVRTTSAKAIADRKELVRRREWLQKESEEWQRKAEIALSKEREELARAALVEKSKVLEAVGIVDDELKALEESLAKLNEDVGLLQQKIKDAKARQNAIVMRGKTAQTRLGV
ncbi:MAG: PspA/IM30 family protein, partial [Gammaproteobacteria bacterium]